MARPQRPENVYSSYGSVPDAAPDVTGTGASPRNIPAPENALSGLAKGLDTAATAGKEYGAAQDALAGHYQDIYNDTTARDGVTGASKDLANLEFQYKQQKGLNAVNALPEFQKQAADIMDKYSSNMPNDMAQKLFKDDFSREVNGAIFRSGGWAADQAESAQVASLNSSMANKINLGALNITDPSSRSSTISGIRDDTLQYAHIRGLSEDAADSLVSNNIGEFYQAGIHAIAQQDPALAKQLFEEASQGAFTANRPDADGKMQEVQVPFISAQHRATISSELNTVVNQQAAEQLFTARNCATSGIDFDKDALTSALHNAGKPKEYIDGEITRLNHLKNNANEVSVKFDIESATKDNESLAFAGRQIRDIPEQTIRDAYYKNPDKAQAIINQNNELKQVAGFVGQLPTKNINQIFTDLEAFNPAKTGGAQSAPTPPSADDLKRVILEQESQGSKTNNLYQIQPAAWHDFAKPGEVITNPKDNIAVGHRIIDSLYDKYKDDSNVAEKVAVGYFSGTGNVSSGTDSAFVNDASDQLGESTSGYVKDINDRLGIVGSDHGEGFAEKQRLYKTLQEATGAYIKDLETDPAGAVISKDNVMAAQLNGAIQDTSKFSAYADSMLKRQELMGIPESARSVLPADTATHIVGKILSDPAGAPKFLDQLRQVSGTQWNSLYGSLVKQGNLPEGYQSVAHLGSDISTYRDATLLARWMGEETKGKAASDILGPDVVSATKKNIFSDPGIQSLMTSLYRSGASTTQIDGIVHSVELLAYAKQFYDKDPTAIQGAINAFTSKYQFIPGSEARVPTGVYDAVLSNSNYTIMNLNHVAIAPPSYATGGPTQQTPDDYFNKVGAAHIWVTSQNEDSLVLHGPDNELVFGRDGKPITVPFSNVSHFAQLQGALIEPSETVVSAKLQSKINKEQRKQ